MTFNIDLALINAVISAGGLVALIRGIFLLGKISERLEQLVSAHDKLQNEFDEHQEWANKRNNEVTEELGFIKGQRRV